MSEVIFSVFPSENFIDMGLYQFGWEQCDPSHSFGPAARNHYLFHYVISGTGTLTAANEKKRRYYLPDKKRSRISYLSSPDMHVYFRPENTMGICLA